MKLRVLCYGCLTAFMLAGPVSTLAEDIDSPPKLQLVLRDILTHGALGEFSDSTIDYAFEYDLSYRSGISFGPEKIEVDQDKKFLSVEFLNGEWFFTLKLWPVYEKNQTQQSDGSMSYQIDHWLVGMSFVTCMGEGCGQQLLFYQLNYSYGFYTIKPVHYENVLPVFQNNDFFNSKNKDAGCFRDTRQFIAYRLVKEKPHLEAFLMIPEIEDIYTNRECDASRKPIDYIELEWTGDGFKKGRAAKSAKSGGRP